MSLFNKDAESGNDEWTLESFMNAGKVEANAELRDLATNLFQMYQALVDSGFSEEQGMAIILQMVASQT